MIRVGIPRALLYYQFYPMWRTFFEGLGATTVVSPPTTMDVLADGSARVIADTCLPVKVFCGHVLALMSECDYLFIPSIRSIEEQVYNCSKFLGIPDVVRAVVPEAPPIIDPDIDVNQGRRALYLTLYRLGRPFTWNPLRVKEAAEAAWQTHLRYRRLMHEACLSPLQASQRIFGEPEEAWGESVVDPRLTVAVIGHPYLIHDDFLNHRLVTRLNRMGVQVATAEMASEEELDAAVAKMVGRPYWTFEDEVIGAGGHYLESGVDGVIAVVAFGCGPDSVMLDVLQRYAKRLGSKPFMMLTLDEHTAEAGLLTRLEAFVDMLERRQRLALVKGEVDG